MNLKMKAFKNIHSRLLTTMKTLCKLIHVDRIKNKVFTSSQNILSFRTLSQHH